MRENIDETGFMTESGVRVTIDHRPGERPGVGYRWSAAHDIVVSGIDKPKM